MIDRSERVFHDRVSIIEFNVVTTACPPCHQVLFWGYYGNELHIVDTAPMDTVKGSHRSIYKHGRMLEFIDENCKRSIRRRVICDEIIDTKTQTDPSLDDMAELPLHERRRLQEPKKRR